MNKTIYLLNLIKVFKLHITGKTMGGFIEFYDKRYSPTKFFKYQYPKIFIQCILCGFPRTGTHWIMNVIEKSTGLKVSDTRAKKPSPSDKNVVLIKIHARNKFIARVKALWLLPPFKFGCKYIYVYRDPRDSIISLYEMYKILKDNDIGAEEFLNSYDPIRQYRWEINAWVLPKHKNVLLVKFEDLKQSPAEGFNRIFEFLRLDYPVNSESIGEMVNVSDSKKRIRGTAYGWKKAPAEYKDIIDAVSNKLSKEIELLGYDKIYDK